MKTKIIPFDLETAKKIQAGEIEGKIITSSLKNRVRILCYDFNSFYREYKLVCAITRNEREYLLNYKNDGFTMNSDEGHLVFEVPDNESQKPQFKPFDKVLGKSDSGGWVPDMYSRMTSVGRYICLGGIYEQIIPYEGNEHLVGTIDKPE